jgi:hypothetical protein
MNRNRARLGFLALLTLTCAALVLSSRVHVDRESADKRSLNVPPFGRQAAPATTTTAQLPAPTAQAHTYTSPTPLFGLPAAGAVESAGEREATAIRSAQLATVPTWPPGAPRPHPTLPPSEPYYPIATAIAGSGTTVDSGFSNLPAALGLFKNQWYAQVGRQIVRVYAGSKAQPSEMDQGLVVVQVQDLDTNSRNASEIYETPSRSGAIEVVGAAGMRLTLRAESGTLFYFDAENHRWVSETGAPIPGTAPPTLTVPPVPSYRASWR